MSPLWGPYYGTVRCSPLAGLTGGFFDRALRSASHNHRLRGIHEPLRAHWHFDKLTCEMIAVRLRAYNSG